MAKAAELTTALGDYQSGKCLELNTTSAVLIKCGCSLYTRSILLDALVRANPDRLHMHLQASVLMLMWGNGHSHRVPASHRRPVTGARARGSRVKLSLSEHRRQCI